MARRIARGLLAAACTAALLPLAPAAAASCGDANDDRLVSPADALVALAASVGQARCFRFLCDADGSGEVAATDAMLILKQAVGLQVLLTCPPDRVLLASEPDRLVAIFAAGDDLLIVDRKRVRKLTLSGETLAEWIAGRPLISASLDEGLLVVADGAKFTTLSPASLEEIGSAITPEVCYDQVLISGPRLICGPSNDWDRIFFTYDAMTGVLLDRSTEYTYEGIAMQRLPGYDGFFTTSQSYFNFFGLSSNRVVQSQSAYGDGDVSDIYAFDGDVAEHLITHDDRVLAIDPAQCFAGGSCLVEDGTLDTLAPFERYAAFARSDRVVVGVVSDDGFGNDSDCHDGCRLVATQMPSREAVAERNLELPLGDILAMAAVSGGRAAVVGGYSADEDVPRDYTDYFVYWLALK